MDGSSLPEPPQREDGGHLRSLLSRAVECNRTTNSAMPAGGNPFARFSHDVTKADAPGAASASTAPSGPKQPPAPVPVPVSGLAMHNIARVRSFRTALRTAFEQEDLFSVIIFLIR